MTETKADDRGAAVVMTRPRGRRGAGRTVGRYAGVLVGLVLVSAYLGATEPVFFTWDNFSNIIRAQTATFLLAIGMTFVLLTAGIDLSVASMTALAMMVLGLTVEAGWAWELAVVVTVLAGIAFGLVNGVLIGIAGITFLVVTLGTLSIYESVALLTTNGETISLFGTAEFAPVTDLVNGSVGPFPVLLLVIVGLYLLGGFVLLFTPFGRAVYAVGSNREAARLSGIKVKRVLVAVYLISGACAGLAAVVLAGRLTASAPGADPTLLLTVVAAVLIGGTAYSGGVGGLLGTAVGVLFLGVVQNGLSISGVSAFWQGLVSGLILIVAVGLGMLRHRGWRIRQRAGARRARAVGRQAS